MDVEVRKAEEEDAELLAEEFWHQLAKEMEDYHEVNELKEEADKRAVKGFKDRLNDNTYEFFFLEVNGEEIAYISLEKGERSTRKLSKYIAIIDLYVKQGFRGEGYGTRLIEEAQKYAEDKNADYMMLAAEWENERAQEFYSKNGFDEKKIEFIKMLN